MSQYNLRDLPVPQPRHNYVETHLLPQHLRNRESPGCLSFTALPQGTVTPMTAENYGQGKSVSEESNLHT
jgi:hypothetical protein